MHCHLVAMGPVWYCDEIEVLGGIELLLEHQPLGFHVSTSFWARTVGCNSHKCDAAWVRLGGWVDSCAIYFAPANYTHIDSNTLADGREKMPSTVVGTSCYWAAVTKFWADASTHISPRTLHPSLHLDHLSSSAILHCSEIFKVEKVQRLLERVWLGRAEGMVAGGNWILAVRDWAEAHNYPV